MKKLKLLTFAALALAATACSSDDVVDAPADAKTPIAFSPYVDYSIQSRSNDITKENISEFAVYGFYQATSGTPTDITKVFNGARVYLPSGHGATGNTENWDCTSTQYWMAGNSYWFCALAPFGGSYTVPFPTTATTTYDGFGDIKFDNSSTGAKAEQDLIYAFNGNPSATVANSGWASEQDASSTGAGGTIPTGLSGLSNDRVPFTFNHLLSRVRIEITTGDGETSVLRISDLKIKEIHKDGKYQTTGASAETWTGTGTDGAYTDVEYAYPSTLYIPGRTDVTSHTAFTSWKSETGNWAEADSTSLVRYFIPGQSSLKLSFTASFYPKGSEPTTDTTPKYKNTSVSPEVSGVYTATDLEAAVSGNFQKGTAYVIKATINAKTIDSSLTNPIKFTVTEENGVEGWGAENEINKGHLPTTTPTNP